MVNKSKTITTLAIGVLIGILTSFSAYKIVKIAKLDRIGEATIYSNITSNTEQSIPKANVEWFMSRMRFNKGMLKNFNVDYSIQGKLVDIKQDEGEITGLKSYYVGKRGSYLYGAKLTLNYEGAIKTIYLSHQRLKQLKIYRHSQSGIDEIQLSDLKLGSLIEVKEGVDLAINSVNDNNVLFIQIHEYYIGSNK